MALHGIMSFAIPRNSKKKQISNKTIGGLEGSTSFDPGFFRWESLSNKSVFHGIWSNYSDLTRVFTPNGGLVRENPLISGKPRLVKYNNLARWNVIMVLLLKFAFCLLMVCLSGFSTKSYVPRVKPFETWEFENCLNLKIPTHCQRFRWLRAFFGENYFKQNHLEKIDGATAIAIPMHVLVYHGPRKLSHLLGVPSILSLGCNWAANEDLVKQHTILKSYSRFDWELHLHEAMFACRKVPLLFRGFQTRMHQWHHPRLHHHRLHQRARMLQCTTLPGHTGHSGDPESHRGGKIVGSCWPHASPDVTWQVPGGTSSNGDPIAPTLSAILGRGIVTLAKCFVLRLSAMFFADEKPYHEKSPLKRVIFFWFTCSNRPS